MKKNLADTRDRLLYLDILKGHEQTARLDSITKNESKPCDQWSGDYHWHSAVVMATNRVSIATVCQSEMGSDWLRGMW